MFSFFYQIGFPTRYVVTYVGFLLFLSFLYTSIRKRGVQAVTLGKQVLTILSFFIWQISAFLFHRLIGFSAL
jgi:hypothetical protein